MLTSFTINGQIFTVDMSSLPPDITLNTFIREHVQLTATKFMCLEGGCGACVCVVKSKDVETGKIHTWAVNSCLTLLHVCRDWEITTCEGIGNKRAGYHPIQKRLAKMNGTQCGFCSPGFVMNMYALLESRGNELTMEEIENSFGGNICRCTGYRPILDAMKSFATDSTIKVPIECQDIEDLTTKICPKTGLNCKGICVKPVKSFIFKGGSKWYWPENLDELFKILNEISDDDQYMLVAGNTAHGVYRRSKDIKHFIDVHNVPELKQHSLNEQMLKIGANCSLTKAMEIFQMAAKSPGFEYCKKLWNHFDLIANVPVRNAGTLAGNIVTKKMYPEFASDIFLTFEALDVQVVVNTSAVDQTKMSLKDYLKSATKKIVLMAFEFPAYPEGKFIFQSYKIMPRAQNAHASVNAAFLLAMETPNGKVKSARICFGGIHPDFIHAKAIESKLTGKVLHEKETITALFNEVPATFKPDAVLPDPSPEYRTLLACGLLYKFLLSIAPEDKVKAEYKSGGEILKRSLSSGTQKFETVAKNYPVTQAVHKLEGLIQCSGEATYMNDTLTAQNTGHCAFAVATKVGATIEEIDVTEVLKMPEVLAFFSAKDIPGKNVSFDKTLDVDDEELFCSGEVKYYGQPFGVMVATTRDAANYAATKVKVIYSTATQKVLATIDDVLEEKLMDRIHLIKASELQDVKLKDKPAYTGSGIFKIGSQYHYTMEPQTTVVVPVEEGLQVYSATQWMDHTQSVIASVLQMKAKDVQLKVRRLGGAYGAKITRGNQVACAAALAAYKLNRPIRFVQSIESMMKSNGKRWACRSDYEFQVSTSGKILGLKNTFYEDAGCTLNESPVAVHSTLCAKNCYEFTNDNYKLDGHAVLTDAPSNSWCRSPGSVEGIAMIENIIEHIAFEANIDPADVRLINIKPGNKMAEILPQFLKSTEYRERRKEIIAFNEKNRWRKKGIGLAIMEYPLFYFGQFSATVAIYHIDGTVVISHGGIEMGQGMNTKIAQLAAFVLGVPLEMIKIEASDTLNGANSFVTGGSIGSEVVCYAVKKACTTLNDRLKPVKESLKKNAPWEEIVQTAWTHNINMIASDHFKVGDLENYNIYGLSLTEVEVDILTGNMLIKRVDIFEDTGESLSPLIDIGQVEGGFVMGLGYWASEQLVYDRRTGKLMTNRTWNYKPPGAKDIPIDFRIELSQKYPNQTGFMRSKATGEPAVCLSVGVIFAIQQAVQSARSDAGLQRKWVQLGAPTTAEKIALNAGTYVKSFSLE